MIHSKRLRLWLYLVLLAVFIGACGMKKEESSKDKQIKENFNKTLSLYPTKNLEDFYDKEGFRDQEFEKGDKGTWIIHSKMTIETNGKNMEHNKIIPTKPIADDKLRKEIENFKFFVQYGDFKDINDYKDGDISYNPNVPSYSAKYQLSNDDYNVKQLRKRYDIPTKKAPKLLIKGDGDLKGSSIGHKNLEFTFIENKEENIYFTDSINFKPTE
ncbi:tandem-type lipoprotein [Staphylococcus aureus]|uniref:tandem-type lipoprotein n=1 Tax=Staphylococcus aureus TaxID=1280 RepID=UPI00174731D5|nr:tandem-type lipoprotein [Staphylococcus aureus]